MKWARFLDGSRICCGYLESGCLFEVEGDIPTGRWEETGVTYPLDDVRLLPPCIPTKVVAIGLNYRDHAEEMELAIPDEPVLFLKPSSSVIGPEEAIIYPEWIGRLDYEAELAIVIGKRAKNVKAAEASEYIWGYTCANDVTARDLQKKDGQWSRAKAFDTFCPLGPWIVTELDPAQLAVNLELNGQKMQSSNTSQLLFAPAAIVEFVTRVMTLEVGDVILTGTPGGIGPMQAGDRVVIRIEEIGDLSNPVVAQR